MNMGWGRRSAVAVLAITEACSATTQSARPEAFVAAIRGRCCIHGSRSTARSERAVNPERGRTAVGFRAYLVRRQVRKRMDLPMPVRRTARIADYNDRDWNGGDVIWT